MNKQELLKKIQQLSFAKVEAELFLDTHPECTQALDYYKKTVNSLEMLMEEYQNTYGPLVAMAVQGDKWTWVDGPWPWHIDWDENANGKSGRNGNCCCNRKRGN